MICNSKKLTALLFMVLICNSLQKESEEEQSTLEKVGWIAVKTAAVSAGVIGGITAIVPALGFSAAGIGAGTLAAAFQSSFLGGSIVSGGTFAVLQSIGAAGLAGSTKAAIVATTGGIMSYFSWEKKEEEKTGIMSYFSWGQKEEKKSKWMFWR